MRVKNGDGFLRQVESERGHFRFPSLVTRAIVNLKIESYPQLCENEAAIGLIVFHSFMTKDELIELNTQLELQSPEERGQSMREFVDVLSELDQARDGHQRVSAGAGF